jgi:hypothetical protein
MWDGFGHGNQAKSGVDYLDNVKLKLTLFLWLAVFELIPLPPTGVAFSWEEKGESSFV